MGLESLQLLTISNCEYLSKWTDIENPMTNIEKSRKRMFDKSVGNLTRSSLVFEEMIAKSVGNLTRESLVFVSHTEQVRPQITLPSESIEVASQPSSRSQQGSSW